MTERDPKVSQRYRELGGEEPPRALDDAILAASRRSVQKRSWNRPIAIAAVIVLAVAVTVHVQREQPAEEMLTASRTEAPAAVPAAPPAAPPAPAQERAEAKQPAPARSRAFTSDSKPQAAPEQSAGAAADSRREMVARDAVSSTEVQVVPAPQEVPAPPPPLAGARAPSPVQGRMAERAEPAAKQAPAAASAMRRMDEARAAPALSKFASHSPEQWLLAIDDLKRQGKHEEADKQLAEFRKRYPDYRIPEAITEKFEKR